MKRPLLMVALLYAAGVIMADCLPLPLAGLLASSSVLALLCLVPSRARPGLFGLLLISIGATNLGLHTVVVSPHDLRLLIGDRIEDATLQGTLRQTPSPKIYEHGGVVSWRTVAELEVNSLRLNIGAADWQPAFGRVAISTPGDLTPTFFAGQQVEVAGQLRRPKTALADGLFDYRKYLRRLGIHYQLQVRSTNAWKLTEAGQGSSAPWRDRFVGWGKAALARGLPVEDESLRLEWALTLGWKPALTEEVSEPFIRASTYHIFAVDGLRIMIISSIFLSLFRVLGISRALSGLMVIPLLWFYASMTGFQASAIRATVMATVVIGGWALKRPSELINSLFAAALIILLMPAFEGYAEHFVKPDPWLPLVLRPRWQRILPEEPDRADAPKPRAPLRPLWQRILRVPGRFFWETFLVSLVAWLGSIPLTACYFNILTPVSAPANLLAVPLCGLVLICNMISLLLAAWFPLGAEIYNHAGWFCMECIRVTSNWSAHWPAAYCYVSAPSLFSTCVYYLLLLTVATGWVFRIKHRAWAIAGLTLLTCVWALHWGLVRQTTSLTVLPVKGAAAIFVDAPGRANDLLIDCGNESAAGFIVKPFLQAHGVNQLPGLILTHGDLNHVGGAGFIWKSFSPPQICLSPIRFRSAAYRRVLDEFEATPGLLKTVQRGDYVGSWQMLHPAGDDHFPQADDNAIVLRGEINGTRVLLLSDLGKPGQNALFGRQPDLRADIVVAGLPQQSEPLAEAVIDAIQPRLIIIADAEYPASARASRKLHERLERRGIPVLCTAQVGAVTLSFPRHGWRVHTMNPPPKPAPPPDPTPVISDPE